MSDIGGGLFFKDVVVNGIMRYTYVFFFRGFPGGPGLPWDPGLPRRPVLPLGPERHRFSSFAQNWFCSTRSSSLMSSLT